ncbi:hypothetical protein [Planctomicrobium piriforme]|nr:hypothetical protein [Planctomicrobium piriforme]
MKLYIIKEVHVKNVTSSEEIEMSIWITRNLDPNITPDPSSDVLATRICGPTVIQVAESVATRLHEGLEKLGILVEEVESCDD